MQVPDEKKFTIYLSAGVVSFSAIAYELVLATYATFLLGSTIFQYALVFSVMMAAMGVGSLLSTRFEDRAYQTFLFAETLLSFLAILSIPLLYYVFSVQIGAQGILIFLVVAFGILIGLEVPLLNIVRENEGSVSQVLFYDYLGGFIGGLAFPLLLLPSLGFFRVSAILALLNLTMAFVFLRVFRLHLKTVYKGLKLALLALGFVAIIYFFSGEIVRHSLEQKLFGIQA